MPSSETPPTVSGLKPCDLIMTGGHVMTLDADMRVIDDGAIAVNDGVIEAVGTATNIAAHYAAARTLDTTGKVVLPGLINAHVHLPWGMGRNAPPFSALSREKDHNKWVETSLIPSWVKLDAETEHVGTLLACCESLKLGVTTVADGGSMQYPDANASAFRACGIRGVIAGLVFDRPPWGRDYSDMGMPTPTTEQALDRVEEIVATYHGGKLSRVQAFASVIGSDTCSDELIVGAKAIADRHAVMLDFHQSVQQFQVEEHRRRMGYSDDPVCYFDRLGALGENVRLLELHVVGDDGIEVLSRRDVSVVVCDPLYMSIGTPEAPSRAVEMQRAGVNVCNGTDDPGFLDVLRFAQMTAAVHRQTEHEMFRYCTINAARSMGLGDVIGSIEVGKEADLVVWGTHGLEWQPFPTPALDGMFKLQVSASGVETVMVGGEMVVEGGELTLVDEGELRQRVQRLADVA